MMRSIVAASAALAALAKPGDYVQCFEEWRCISHATVNGQLYSWDFRPLCRRPGSEYQLQDSRRNWWAFNVCGMVSYSCIPDTWTDPFNHGIAHQYLEGTPQQATTPGTGNTACKATTVDPDTGSQTCKSQCVMAAVDEPDYELVNPNDQTQGVSIYHAGVPPDQGAPFDCPYDPSEGCPGSRKMTYLFTCDKNQKNGLGNMFINETSSCNYVLSATTAYACPTTGDIDPYDTNRDGKNFAYVCLGAGLCILVQFIYHFGEPRGWWEPIKQRLPAIPGFSSGKGGVFGAGGSYRTVSTTPITSSPYGSTSM